MTVCLGGRDPGLTPSGGCHLAAIRVCSHIQFGGRACFLPAEWAEGGVPVTYSLLGLRDGAETQLCVAWVGLQGVAKEEVSESSPPYGPLNPTSSDP